MLRDGIYHVAYCSAGDASSTHDEALAVVRGGNILASDRHGGVYTGMSGQHASDGQGDDGLEDIVLTCDVPPGGELVTGFCAGSLGATIPIHGELNRDAVVQSATLVVAGQRLDVELAYLGPLPK